MGSIKHPIANMALIVYLCTLLKTYLPNFGLVETIDIFADYFGKVGIPFALAMFSWNQHLISEERSDVEVLTSWYEKDFIPLHESFCNSINTIQEDKATILKSLRSLSRKMGVFALILKNSKRSAVALAIKKKLSQTLEQDSGSLELEDLWYLALYIERTYYALLAGDMKLLDPNQDVDSKAVSGNKSD